VLGELLQRYGAIEEALSVRKRELESWIHQRLLSRSDRLIIGRAIEGGKRLRPVFLLILFDALGGKDRRVALDVAFALELAHAASLMHDDIIDWDSLRRGKPALWRQIGISRAIIEGHRIINLAFKTVLEKGVEISRIFLEAWDKASLGVLEEILSTTPPSKLLYLRIIENKTASLFAAAAESAAVLAGVSDDVRFLAKEYGRLVGIVYQLGDDYADIVSNRGLARVLKSLGRVEELVRQGYFALRSGKLMELLKLWEALRGFQGYMHEILRESLSEIDRLTGVLPVTPEYRELLREFPRYCLLRMVREAG
jgi:octaprenyl-diphosphate synthase